ncbi:MAG: flagellar hook-basal body complex protein, partial [Desulfovibrionaceae bacterium]
MAFSSLYTGATGLAAYSTALQVVGNNLANVSTTGYKKSEILFSDLISQYLSSGNTVMPSGANATSQVGMGVAVGDVGVSFLQGGMESTNEATDLAISGAGFFGVRNAADDATYYTRNGVFRFDENGYLRDTGGNYVQG